MAGSVGKVSIRVFPDTSKFREDVKKTLERLQKSLHGKVNIEIELDRASIAKMRKTLKSLNEVIHLNAEADVSRANEKLEEIKENLEATVNVDADTAKAKASIWALARDRAVNLYVKLNGVGAAKTALMSLAGGNVLKNLGTRVKDLATNFDTVAVRVGKISTAVALLGAGGFSALGSLSTIATSLASIAAAGLALPGIFAGAGIGAGVLFTALADIKTVLGDLGPQFSQLQDGISGSFWEQAAQPMRDMVNTLLPAVSGGLQNVAAELGRWTTAIAATVSSTENIATIRSIIDATADSINIAGDGVGAFFNGLIALAGAGAQYLAPLAGWANDIAYAFEDWATKSVESGQIFSWIDGAIENLKALGQIVAATGGIIGALATAAANAGSGGLGALADGMTRVSEAMNAPVFQGALTTLFEGAYAAISNLAPGVAALGDAFVALAPVISSAMATAAEAVATLAQGIAQGLASPELAAGINDLFAGIQAAATALAPAFAALGPLIGALASTFGTLLETLAPIIEQIVVGLAPAFTELVTALQPVIEQIGGALASALEAIIPFISEVITWIAQWVENNPQLAATVLLIVAAVGGFVAALIGLIGAIAPVITGIAAVVAAVGAVPVLIGAAIAAIIAVIIGLVVAIVANWNSIVEWTTNTWNTIVDAVSTAVNAVVDWVSSAWSGLVGLVSDIWNNVSNAVSSAWNAIVQWVSNAVSSVSNAVSSGFSAVSSFIGSIMNSISSTISSIWNSITSFIGSAINNIRSAISAGFQAALSIVRSILSSVLSTVSSVFSSVVSAVTGAMARFGSAVSNGISAVVRFFVNMGSQIVSTIAGLAGRMVSMGSQIIQGLINGIKNAAGGVVSAITGVVDGAISAAKNLLGIHSPSRVFRAIGDYTMQGFVQGVDSGASSAQASMVRAIRPPAAASLSAPDIGAAATTPGTASGITIENVYGLTPEDVARQVMQLFNQQNALYGHI